MRLVKRHSAVPPGSAEADVASFEDGDLETRVSLLEEISRDEAGVSAAETDDVRLPLAFEGGLEMRAIDRLEPEAFVGSKSR
jgi:hypothetical protein